MGAPPQQPGQPLPGSEQERADQQQPVFEHGRMITFKKRHVDPPTLYYFGPDDKLGISWASTLAAAQLSVGGRMLSPNGRIIPFSFLFQNPTPGKFMFPVENLGEGFLLSVVANSENATVQRGQMYVDMYYVGHGSGLLAQGYVDDSHSVGWPPGIDEDPLSGMGAVTRVFPGNQPVGNAYVYTVPNNLAVKLRGVDLTLITSAVVANRLLFIQFIDSGGSAVCTALAGAVQAAGLSGFYHFGLGLDVVNPAGAIEQFVAPLPDLLMRHGDTIKISAVNLDAGDQITSPGLQLEQWIIDQSF